MAKAAENKAPTLTILEKEGYKQILDNQDGFPWTLIQDKDTVEKYWLSAMLPNAEPPVVVPIGPELQIGEPGWAGFTVDGTFV